ncbi:MAG TPA: DUF3857 domain-containing protein [Terracidiphilus sp.]|nr:DUF3857 domain-containing protein [Terracidiphilus sp.]
MRIRLFAVALFSALGFFATSLHAQFQEPTKDELQMTSDPKAPGAAATYLNVEEITDDPLHYHSFYARIKVLQEKGKDLATVEIPYQHGNYKVTDIRGRTIHSDGTIIPLEGKPEDLLTSKFGDKQLARLVFTLPSAEVGSILEYRYQLRYDDNHYSSPSWQIQRPYFVHKAHYAFTPFKAFLKGAQNVTSQFLIDAKGNAVNSLIYWPVLPTGAKVVTDGIGRYSLDVSDIPAIPDEEWMPPVASILYHVLFYYKSAFNSADFWISEAKRWSKDVDHFAEPSKPIQAAVAGIIAPGDNEREKARKLYKAVQALDNTDFSREKGKAELKQLGLRVAKRAEDTWAQKSGSSQDITLLYLAMLRAAGLTAYDMKVVDRDRGIFAPGYLEFDQLDDDIVLAMIDGKEVALDPGEKMCPFELMHWKHTAASGIRQGPEGRDIYTSQLLPYTANTLTRIGEVTVDAHGAVTGSFRFIMVGQGALRWRQAELENDPDEVKKSFDRWLQGMLPEGVQGHLDHLIGADDPDVNLIAFVNVQGALGTATAKRLLMPGFFFETRSRQPFVEEATRVELVDMHYGEKVTDQVTYHLPDGMTIEGTPQDVNIPFAKMAVFATKTIPAQGKVTEAREMLRGFTFVTQEQYSALRDFYQKINASDQQQLVLTAAPSAKGN